MEYIPIRARDLIHGLNRDLYLPAIQREFVWGTERIERLFDSVMADFPIGSFLYWRLEQKNKAAAYHVTKHRFERILPLLLLSMENHTPLSQPAQGASGKCREPR